MNNSTLQRPQTIGQPRIHPSRLWYALALIILLAGVTCFVVYLVSLFTGDKFTLQRVVVPGTHQLEFAEAGKYVVFHEYRSVVEGEVFSTGSASISGLECSLRPVDAGPEIELSPIFGNVTYDLGPRSGQAILKSYIRRPGAYVFTAEYPDGSQEPRVVLAIGANPVKKVIVAVAICAMLLVGPVLLSAAVLGITRYRRWQAGKKLGPLGT